MATLKDQVPAGTAKLPVYVSVLPTRASLVLSQGGDQSSAQPSSFCRSPTRVTVEVGGPATAGSPATTPEPIARAAPSRTAYRRRGPGMTAPPRSRRDPFGALRCLAR